MRILVIGGTGFIGSAIARRLAAKHEIIIGSRTRPPYANHWRKVDFMAENDWDELLKEVDLVINAVGIIKGDFRQIHTTAPLQLVRQCIRNHIRILNISAIGAERENPPTEFLQTKKVADDVVLSYPQGKVVYPGIVLGREGKSSRFFKFISRFPVIPLIGGDPPLVHIEQLTDLIARLVDDFDAYPSRVFAIGRRETMAALYTALRGGRRAIHFRAPLWPAKLLFKLFPNLQIGIFGKNMLTMAEVISMDDYEPSFPDKATEYIR